MIYVMKMIPLELSTRWPSPTFKIGFVAFVFTFLLLSGFSAGQQRRSKSVSSSSSSSSSASVSHVVEFDCPEEFGYYPHPTDCTQYYVCVFGGALLESCTGGLMYSHELQTCDWPRNVGCGGEVSASSGNSNSGNGNEDVVVATVSTVRVTDPRSRQSPQLTRNSAATQQRQLQREEAIPKHHLYTEEDLGPAEEIESDRQQRVYRGQPATLGQVARDRDGLSRHSNALQVSPGTGREKLSVVSFGSQQQYSTDPLLTNKEGLLQYDFLETNILTDKKQRNKRQAPYSFPGQAHVVLGSATASPNIWTTPTAHLSPPLPSLYYPQSNPSLLWYHHKYYNNLQHGNNRHYKPLQTTKLHRQFSKPLKFPLNNEEEFVPINGQSVKLNPSPHDTQTQSQSHSGNSDLLDVNGVSIKGYTNVASHNHGPLFATPALSPNYAFYNLQLYPPSPLPSSANVSTTEQQTLKTNSLEITSLTSSMQPTVINVLTNFKPAPVAKLYHSVNNTSNFIGNMPNIEPATSGSNNEPTHVSTEDGENNGEEDETDGNGTNEENIGSDDDDDNDDEHDEEDEGDKDEEEEDEDEEVEENKSNGKVSGDSEGEINEDENQGREEVNNSKGQQNDSEGQSISDFKAPEFPTPPEEFYRDPRERYKDVYNPFSDPDFDFDKFLYEISDHKINPTIIPQVGQAQNINERIIETQKKTAEDTNHRTKNTKELSNERDRIPYNHKITEKDITQNSGEGNAHSNEREEDEDNSEDTVHYNHKISTDSYEKTSKENTQSSEDDDAHHNTYHYQRKIPTDSYEADEDSQHSPPHKNYNTNSYQTDYRNIKQSREEIENDKHADSNENMFVGADSNNSEEKNMKMFKDEEIKSHKQDNPYNNSKNTDNKYNSNENKNNKLHLNNHRLNKNRIHSNQRPNVRHNLSTFHQQRVTQRHSNKPNKTNSDSRSNGSSRNRYRDHQSKNISNTNNNNNNSSNRVRNVYRGQYKYGGKPSVHYHHENGVKSTLKNINQQSNDNTNKHENTLSEPSDSSSKSESLLEQITEENEDETKQNTDKKHTNLQFFNFERDKLMSSESNKNESGKRARNHRYDSDLTLDTVTPFAYTMLGDFKKFKEIQLGTSPLNPFRSEDSFEDPLDTTEPTLYSVYKKNSLNELSKNKDNKSEKSGEENDSNEKEIEDGDYYDDENYDDYSEDYTSKNESSLAPKPVKPPHISKKLKQLDNITFESAKPEYDDDNDDDEYDEEEENYNDNEDDEGEEDEYDDGSDDRGSDGGDDYNSNESDEETKSNDYEEEELEEDHSNKNVSANEEGTRPPPRQYEVVENVEESRMNLKTTTEYMPYMNSYRYPVSLPSTTKKIMYQKSYEMYSPIYNYDGDNLIHKKKYFTTTEIPFKETKLASNSSDIDSEKAQNKNHKNSLKSVYSFKYPSTVTTSIPLTTVRNASVIKHGRGQVRFDSNHKNKNSNKFIRLPPTQLKQVTKSDSNFSETFTRHISQSFSPNFTLNYSVNHRPHYNFTTSETFLKPLTIANSIQTSFTPPSFNFWTSNHTVFTPYSRPTTATEFHSTFAVPTFHFTSDPLTKDQNVPKQMNVTLPHQSSVQPNNSQSTVETTTVTTIKNSSDFVTSETKKRPMKLHMLDSALTYRHKWVPGRPSVSAQSYIEQPTTTRSTSRGYNTTQYTPSPYDSYYSLYEDDAELYKDIDYTQYTQPSQRQQQQQQSQYRGQSAYKEKQQQEIVQQQVQQVQPQPPPRKVTYTQAQPTYNVQQDVYSQVVSSQDYNDNYNLQVEDDDDDIQAYKQAELDAKTNRLSHDTSTTDTDTELVLESSSVPRLPLLMAAANNAQNTPSRHIKLTASFSLEEPLEPAAQSSRRQESRHSFIIQNPSSDKEKATQDLILEYVRQENPSSRWVRGQRRRQPQVNNIKQVETVTSPSTTTTTTKATTTTSTPATTTSTTTTTTTTTSTTTPATSTTTESESTLDDNRLSRPRVLQENNNSGLRTTQINQYRTASVLSPVTQNSFRIIIDHSTTPLSYQRTVQSTTEQLQRERVRSRGRVRATTEPDYWNYDEPEDQYVTSTAVPYRSRQRVRVKVQDTSTQQSTFSWSAMPYVRSGPVNNFAKETTSTTDSPEQYRSSPFSRSQFVRNSVDESTNKNNYYQLSSTTVNPRNYASQTRSRKTYETDYIPKSQTNINSENTVINNIRRSQSSLFREQEESSQKSDDTVGNISKPVNKVNYYIKESSNQDSNQVEILPSYSSSSPKTGRYVSDTNQNNSYQNSLGIISIPFDEIVSTTPQFAIESTSEVSTEILLEPNINSKSPLQLLTNERIIDNESEEIEITNKNEAISPSPSRHGNKLSSQSQNKPLINFEPYSIQVTTENQNDKEIFSVPLDLSQREETTPSFRTRSRFSNIRDKEPVESLDNVSVRPRPFSRNNANKGNRSQRRKYSEVVSLLSKPEDTQYEQSPSSEAVEISISTEPFLISITTKPVIQITQQRDVNSEDVNNNLLTPPLVPDVQNSKHNSVEDEAVSDSNEIPTSPKSSVIFPSNSRIREKLERNNTITTKGFYVTEKPSIELKRKIQAKLQAGYSSKPSTASALLQKSGAEVNSRSRVSNRCPKGVENSTECNENSFVRIRPTTGSLESQTTPGLTRGSSRNRGVATYTVSPNEAEPAPPNRGTPASISRGRPTLKPSTQIVSKAAEYIDIYKYPPKRPDPIYPTPQVDKTAAKCRKDVCLLPDCSCGGKDVPGELLPEETPQIVLMTFDDSVNDLNKGLYSDLFEKGRTNPNGCPISATFYVSHEWTDYSQVQNLYSAGHEIASHSVSHSFGEQFSQKKWTREIAGQREILAAYGGVRQEDIRGMRAPFLAIGGNKMFKMLYDSNFTYDSSMPVYENRPPSWPYTLDYKVFHDCMIPPCPTRSYPGVWEVPMVMWQDLNGGRCSMGDACSNPPTADGVYKMLIKNFERHFTSNRAPFGLFYHAAWFTQPHHKEGFIAFLDTIVNMPEVWLVSNWQALQWVRDPTPINRLNSFAPFQCNYPERPRRCNNPKVCNLWHKSGVRYMRTCQPCPEVYPWTGKTGVRNSRADNDIVVD